jgi:uncharacterized protein YegP (UPF0339 family)
VLILEKVSFPLFAHDLTPGTELKESLNMAYYVYKDVNGQWRWYLQAANNRKIANSGEGYYNKQDCLDAIKLVKGSSNAPVHEV